MRAHYIIILFFFFFISLSTSFRVQLINAAQECKNLNSNNEQKNRRILHQPLFPLDSPLPPPPPLPPTPDQPFDQPFSNELPPFDQTQQSPPLPAIGTAVTTPVAAHHPSTNLTKKLAVATLSTIITLAMLSAMAFYLYKNRAKHTDDESHKLVGGNSTRINEESRMPPSTLHCIERAEPSTSGSPYQKLNPGKASNHYRPSPDLQPLPPLIKPPPPFRINSPPPMSSSDDESHETRVYALQGTSPSSHHRNISNNTNRLTQDRPENHVAASVPYSKRTPPKSRFSASSPDAPTSKQPFPPSPPLHTASLGPLQPSKTLPFSPKRTKFSPSPPSPAIGQRRSKSNYQQKISTIPIPPPPPPPRKYGDAKNCTPLPVSKQLMRSQSKSPSPKASPSSEKSRPLEIYKNGDGRWMIL